MIPDLLPGEYVHVHAGKTASGTFNIDEDYRVIDMVHTIDMNGFLTTVTATNDVKNSFPVTGVDQREILNEYTLINNKEATDMKGGAVDLLIPIIAACGQYTIGVKFVPPIPP